MVGLPSVSSKAAMSATASGVTASIRATISSSGITRPNISNWRAICSSRLDELSSAMRVPALIWARARANSRGSPSSAS